MYVVCVTHQNGAGQLSDVLFSAGASEASSSGEQALLASHLLLSGEDSSADILANIIHEIKILGDSIGNTLGQVSGSEARSMLVEVLYVFYFVVFF
jgi:hypothetical protein